MTVSLVFNDGLATQYRNAAPLLDSRGLDGTFYVASSWVKSNDAKYMRFYHLDDLYRQGHEIGGMGKDHKNLTTTYDPSPAADLAYKRDQVCGDHQALTGWGYHPVSFAYPAAAENATVQGIVRDCGFTTGRVAGGLSASGPVYAEPVPPANALRLRAMTTPTGPVSLQSLQNAVLAAGAHGGGWLPIAFNEVCSPADASYTTCMNGNKPVDAGVLASFLDWLGTQSAEGVSVRTVRQVMGSAQPPLPPRPFAVSLTFDDGLRSHYGLKDIFARHGVAGSFYINSGAVDAGEAGTMSWAQIRDLQAAGNDVGGHTRDHVNLLATDTSYEFKTRQVCDDRQRLLDEGINAVSFAYPFGAMDATAQPFIRGCGYQSGRKAGTVTSNGPIYSETIPVTENPYAVRILGTNENGPVTLEALQYAVNQAIKYGGSWLPTLFHQICYAGTLDVRHLHGRVPSRLRHHHRGVPQLDREPGRPQHHGQDGRGRHGRRQHRSSGLGRDPDRRRDDAAGAPPAHRRRLGVRCGRGQRLPGRLHGRDAPHHALGPRRGRSVVGPALGGPPRRPVHRAGQPAGGERDGHEHPAALHRRLDRRGPRHRRTGGRGHRAGHRVHRHDAHADGPGHGRDGERRRPERGAAVLRGLGRQWRPRGDGVGPRVG